MPRTAESTPQPAAEPAQRNPTNGSAEEAASSQPPPTNPVALLNAVRTAAERSRAAWNARLAAWDKDKDGLAAPRRALCRVALRMANANLRQVESDLQRAWKILRLTQAIQRTLTRGSLEELQALRDPNTQAPLGIQSPSAAKEQVKTLQGSVFQVLGLRQTDIEGINSLLEDVEAVLHEPATDLDDATAKVTVLQDEIARANAEAADQWANFSARITDLERTVRALSKNTTGKSSSKKSSSKKSKKS